MGNVLIFNRDYQSKREDIKAKKPLAKLVRKFSITYKKYSSPNEKSVRVTTELTLNKQRVEQQLRAYGIGKTKFCRPASSVPINARSSLVLNLLRMGDTKVVLPGTPRYSQVLPGSPKYSQVLPGTPRYSHLKNTKYQKYSQVLPPEKK